MSSKYRADEAHGGSPPIVETHGPSKSPIVEFSDITGAAPYDPTDPALPKNRHIGQRKLFLNEMQFLTRIVKESTPTLVVYAGGAPSNKAAFLAEMFPRAIFALVDPNPFVVFPPTRWNKDSPFGPSDTLPKMLVFGSEEDGTRRHKILAGVKKVRAKYGEMVGRITGDASSDSPEEDPRERIFLFNTFYVPEHSAVIREVFKDARIMFMSDIRTSIDDTSSPGDVDICWNTAQQYVWTAILRAEASMLKWRHPHRNPEDSSMDSPHRFTQEDFRLAAAGKYRDEAGHDHEFTPVDFIADYHRGVLRAPKGPVYIQPWARPASAETRLVFERDAPIVEHPRDYGDRMFWYNSKLRCGPRENLALVGATLTERYQLGLDECNDCALESEIWRDYLVARNPKISPADVPAEVRSRIGHLIGATGNRPLHPRNYVGKIR